MPRPDIDPIAGDRTGECGIFLFCSCNRSISHGFNCYAQGWRLSLYKESDYNQNESILTLITQDTPLLVKGLWPMILPSIKTFFITKVSKLNINSREWQFPSPRLRLRNRSVYRKWKQCAINLIMRIVCNHIS